MPASTSLYRSGYRRLLKAAHFAFKGDDKAVQHAQRELRSAFFAQKHVTDHQKLQELSKDVDDIEEMLRFQIVQAKKNAKGNFEVPLKEEHLTTIEAEQHLPHGPELTPIDPSFIGQHVTVTKSKGSGIVQDKSDFKPVQ